MTATQRKKNWTTITTFLFPFAFTSFSMIISDFTHCFHRLLFIFIVLQISTGSRLLPNFSDDVSWTMVTIICFHTPVCQAILQASSCIVRLVSIFRLQAILSLIYWCHVAHADDGCADDNVGGVQFYSYGVMTIV